MPALYTGIAIIAWMTFATLVAGVLLTTAFILAHGIRGTFRKLRDQASRNRAYGDGPFNGESEHGRGDTL